MSNSKKILTLVIIFSIIISLGSVTNISASSTSEILFRDDNLEGHNLGSVYPTLSVTTFGGVVTSDKKGGLNVTSTGTNGEIVSMLDKNNTSTKAIKLSRTTSGNSIFQFLTDSGASGHQSYVTNDIYVYKLSLKGDSTNNINYTDIGKARLYMATGRIDTIADATAVPPVTLKTYNNVFNNTSSWFDFTYVVDKPNDTISIYINDELKITQKYGGIFNNADGVKNTNPRVYTSGTSTGGTIYIDNILAYSPKNLPVIPQDIANNLACEANTYWDTEADILTENPTITEGKLLDKNFSVNKKGAVSSADFVKQGASSLKWTNHPYFPTLSTKKIPTDMSEFNSISIMVYSTVRTDEEITLMLYSDGNTTAYKDGYLYKFSINFEGWTKISIPLSDFKKYEAPSGWNKIDSLAFHTKMFGKQPNPYTELYIDDIQIGFNRNYPSTFINPQYVPPTPTHRTVEFDPTILNHSFPEVKTFQNSPFIQQAYFKGERAINGYFPKYNPGVVSFDKFGKLYMKFGATIIQTKNAQNQWTSIDLEPTATAYVKNVLNKNTVLFSDDTSSIDEYIRFDDENDAYVTMTVYGDTNAYGLLLHSTDNMVNWAVYQLPYRFSRFERVDGNNTQCMSRPPLILQSDYFIGANKGAYFILPQKKPDGTLVTPFTPIQYADKSVSIAIHSGDANFAVSSDNKIFLTYSICDPTVDVSSLIPANHFAKSLYYWEGEPNNSEKKEFRNGTPTFVKMYDLQTKVLSAPVFIGFGGTALDNHNWPGITIDNQGFLHIIANGHHDPFYYVKSASANSISSWENGEIVGMGTTYASVNMDNENNLFVFVRDSSVGYVFNLTLFKKQGSGAWSTPTPIVKKASSYYNVYRHRITMDKNGKLYLYYQSQAPLKEVFKDELDASAYITPENLKEFFEGGTLLPIGTYLTTPKSNEMFTMLLREPTLLVSNNPSRTSFKLALSSDLNDVVEDNSESDYIVREDNFEGYTTGNLDGTNNLSLADGTLFKGSATSSDFKGGWQLAPGTGTKFNLVSTTGKNGTQTKALKVSRDTINNATGIFGIGTTGAISNNGKVVWEANLQNGGDGNSDLGSILIDKIRYYPGQGRIDFLADATANPPVTLITNAVNTSTTQWFRFRYELNYQTETVSIYINDVLKASQKYGGKYPADYLTNGNLRFYVESSVSQTLPSALFIDDVKIYSPGDKKTLAIATTIPQDNAQNVPINQPITINFNKPVNGATLNTITLTGEGDSAPQANTQIIYDPNNSVTSVTITLQNNLEYPKKYTVNLSDVLDIDGNNIVTSNQQFSFTTDNQGMLLLRYEDFEDFNTGNIWLPTKVANITPPKKIENGTTYSINSQTPKLTGGISFNALKTGSEINLVQITDNNGNTIKALQSLNTDNVEGYSTQIEFNDTFDLNGAKRYIFKARVRGGNGSDQLAYFTSIGNIKIHYANMLTTVGGTNTDGEKNYLDVIPANGTWFDIKYELDLVNKIALIYINDSLIASQIMPENMSIPSNSYMRLQDYTLGRTDATYIDKIEAYAFKEAPTSYATVPTFKINNTMIDRLGSINPVTITGETYYINKDNKKNISVVYGLYDGEKLVSLKIDTKEVEKDVRTAFNCTFTTPSPQVKYQIKTILLDNLSNVTPLQQSYLISENKCCWK